LSLAAPGFTELDPAEVQQVLGSEWVGDWGRCTGCHKLARIYMSSVGRCEPCYDEDVAAILVKIPKDPEIAMAQVAAMNSVLLRPARVIAARRAARSSDTATLVLPDDLSPAACAVGTAVARLATRRLVDGWSLDRALRQLAAGRDIICRELAALGITYDRKTVARALNELVGRGVLRRAGQLDEWYDQDALLAGSNNPFKSGAFTYALVVRFRGLGDLARSALITNATLGGIPPQTRIRACLRRSIQAARPGQRNAIGFWLSMRCIEVGLAYQDAAAVITSYRESVGQGGHRYTATEAMATLRSAYRHHAS
jgi:hypothetical protein